MSKNSFILSGESLTVYIDGVSHVFASDAPQYSVLKKFLFEDDWESVKKNLSLGSVLKTWAKGNFGVDAAGDVTFKGEKIPKNVLERIKEMAAKNLDPAPIFRFWERLSLNPSHRSVNQLFDFMVHKNIPLTPDGCLLMYKSVRADFRDHHTGTFDNSPGRVLEMPRNKVSDDPSVPCHEGLHVGTLDFVLGFGSGEKQIVICKVDPRDVVSVPDDANQQKMRVCKYRVLGVHGGEPLPSTVYLDPVDSSEGIDQDEAEKAEDAALPVGNRKRIKNHRFNSLTPGELMSQTTEDLRAYASSILKIVGASKIPGGKSALVQKIVSTR